MLIRDLLLPEFDQEMANTRPFLERFPEDHLDWRPHPRSQTLQALVSHVVNLPSWMGTTLGTAELDFAAHTDWKTPQVATQTEALAAFDAHVAAARTVLAATTDEAFAGTWTLRQGEKIFFTRPRTAVVRDFVFSHLVHHRAQLGVYLRLLEVPVPPAYGPTADAQM
jgi:uncharacterized damage-inducible protein DinB